MKFFEEDSTVYNRALQIWRMFIGMAHNRQTTTYGALTGHWDTPRREPSS